jgi:hypothetical protein
MAISLKRPVHGGARYTVRFTNHLGSGGVVLVLVGWVPNHGAAVPEPTQMVVPPNSTREMSDVVPPATDARRMTVVADLDQGESGTLELLEGDLAHSAEPIAETTTWKMVVI